ncbi:MAG TPA: 2-oxoacid:acceptor oxidoreductase subunit alpha, partial [Anaerolineales bacterium]|nr:2-oxoacid:acceptor oxidoreductase subunit alpha [Anaerolineales bacterium]
TGHNEQAVYSERSDDWEVNMARLMQKHETAREHLPRPIVDDANQSRVGLIAFGSTDPAVQEARARLAEEGFTVDYLRLRAVPFSQEVTDFIRAHEVCYVIEMNTDGQMHKLLQLETPDLATRLRSLARNNGLPLSARWIAESLQAAEEG